MKKAEMNAGRKNKAPQPARKLRVTSARGPQTQTFLTQVLDKGKFHKLGDTLSIPAGESLNLRCKGNPVQWTVPHYLEEENEGRLSTVQHKHYSSLTLSNATGTDTGQYTCYPMYCEDKDCRKEYNKAIKVFIFFPDPHELFVPSAEYYEVIQLRSNRPTTLPCQVTSPLAKVTLHREFPPEEVQVDGSEISFDVKKGFTIHRPRPHHAGALFCVASLGGLRQSSTKYLLIYVNYPMSPPSPKIQLSSSSVRIGENLQVSCTVEGELDVDIVFTWEFPGQKLGRPLYTQDSMRLIRTGGQDLQVSETLLLVDEIRDVDKGTYTCTAQNLEGSRSVSTMVKVLRAKTISKAKKH
ncbi:platelet-derived growth factor receptor-like protein [Scleropages formosus]|uniref:platelet-derived growth factor receptor-like protein n=1 Tax=Scleropages formosus TaxID=113540 RepID=UPI000878E54E|nr:platelet-derived growth factor receptor-like protein [Scleropages formosus]